MPAYIRWMGECQRRRVFTAVHGKFLKYVYGNGCSNKDVWSKAKNAVDMIKKGEHDGVLILSYQKGDELRYVSSVCGKADIGTVVNTLAEAVVLAESNRDLIETVCGKGAIETFLSTGAFAVRPKWGNVMYG